MLTANRPDSLTNSVTQFLTSVRGANKEDLLIFQDGTNGDVAAAARALGFEPHQHVSHLRATGDLSRDGAAHIALHYKFTLER
jgi:hypothetical protein